jgi:two-component system response regulator AtoC
VSLAIPPLRERVDEIPRLANEFTVRFCRESKRLTLPISDAAMAVLKAYRWPGNVRELRNVIERAVVFCKTVAIAPEHLGLPLDRSSRPPSGFTPAAMNPYDAFLQQPPPQQQHQQQHHHHPSGPPAPFPTEPPAAQQLPSQPPFPSSPPAAGAGTMAFGSSLPAEVDALERERILAVLAQCGGNQTQAAEMLGISRRTLLRRLDEYAVPRPRKT